ncbi:hypothetical protein [Allobranchiibius sp. CTAmp26]|uniref:hypothetical protein n=1 Tax=Allobranchiibius sp. CTAmp26 TaxID=2815214 RepID=UPI001AA15D56|nr:hypothetical protein [Allobranchiibius sp. CTAmp26]MBO1754060.1 hypothetical protein [Allobranchiibius sp. CTAmp26]
MPSESGQTRTVYVPRTGTKVTLLVGLALIIAAIYVAVVPLSVTSKSGPNFGCGTAVSPNNDSFGKTYCSAVDSGARYRAVALGAGGLVLAGVGAALFGFDTSTRTRTPRPGFDDGYDDDADDLPSRGSRGGRRTDSGASDHEAQADPAGVGGERTPVRAAPARTSPARVGGASPAPRRAESAGEGRSAVDTAPAHAAHEDAADDGSAEEEPRSSLRRPFGDRLSQRARPRVDDDVFDGEYDEPEGPRSRR